MNPVETYLRSLYSIYASGAGVAEISYYPPLANLLDEVGQTLKPRVRCILNLKNIGAGLPDGGLFTADQFPKAAASPTGVLLPSTPPGRGVIEVKATGADIRKTAHGPQVAKYLAKYRHVLVTNYRDFVFLGLEAQGRPIELESYSLAGSEAEFWAGAAQPRAMAQTHGDRLVEYLKRVMLRPAPLTAPEEVAWFLASYAREAHQRLETAAVTVGPVLTPLAVTAGPDSKPPASSLQVALDQLRTALEQALGLAFTGTKGERFFRSTLVQTLLYGIFSAWVLWHNENPTRQDHFEWRLAHWYLRVPMIQTLFGQLAQPGSVGAQRLNLEEALNWAGDALNRVERAEFFSRFETGQAIQYFYEPFLQAFSPELRKELGVWYTPPQIVRYMVSRIDTVLREELGLADGLADEQVYILDPCCGTGAYLVEVLRQIATSLSEKGADALTGYTVKRAALSRVFGFELMPAPFVIAHLQLGLFLQSLGTPLAPTERAGVYLTNALTGWQPPAGPKQQLMFPTLTAERDAADAIKRGHKIIVILGNPPYNGYAGLAMAEERDLTGAYRTARRAPAPQGQGLNDLYVRFFRMAERQIVEHSGRGVVCYISNYSWLDGLSFTGMRERYLEVFDAIWIDNLHGDRIISEYAPDGRTSETVFAMQGTSAGIKVGTSISLLVKKGGKKSETSSVYYRDRDEARAEERKTALLASLTQTDFNESYISLHPIPELGLPLKPKTVGHAYLSWPLLPELFPTSFPGIQPSHDELVVDIDRDRLVRRMEQYFDPKISHEAMRGLAPQAMRSTDRFSAEAVRDYSRQRGFLPENIVRYYYRPFDMRWLYWGPETKLLDEKRAEYFYQVSTNNMWLGAAQRNRRDFDPPLVATRHCSRHIIERGANLFPLYLKIEKQGTLFANLSDEEKVQPNLANKAAHFLADLEVKEEVETLFYHTLAVLYAPKYREENSGALRQDWPRIPLPDHQKVLRKSAALGQQLAALLDPERPVPGVTTGTIRPELKMLGVISRVEGGSLDPATELALTAGWGYAGRGGITMPGQGQMIERDFTPAERAAIERGAAALGLSLDQLDKCLGLTTGDVYLNDMAYWTNIPLKVWQYTIGGYQVIKKWLSYREAEVLGRPLRPEEAYEVTHMVRRLTAIILLEPALDANYQAIKKGAYAWPTG